MNLIKMAKRKFLNKKRKKFITIMLFIIFSAVLFINNTTQLLNNWFNLNYFQINTIAWIGIVGSLIYAMWKYFNKEF